MQLAASEGHSRVLLRLKHKGCSVVRLYQVSKQLYGEHVLQERLYRTCLAIDLLSPATDVWQLQSISVDLVNIAHTEIERFAHYNPAEDSRTIQKSLATLHRIDLETRLGSSVWIRDNTLALSRLYLPST